MSVETRLRQLEERVKSLEEKMEYVWMGFSHFIKSVGEAKTKQEAEGYDTVQELFEDNYHDPKQALQHESRADNKTTVEEAEG